jgi:putative transposase
MANTYTQIQIHAVYAVKHRKALIHKKWQTELHQYTTGIITNQGHKLLAVNSVHDHLHLLIGMRPVQSLSDLMEEVKGSSSKWINEKGLTSHHFNWQAGFGAFSISSTSVPSVAGYIMNQEEHHKKKSFREEYLELLKEYDIDFNERYIFADPE